MKIGVLLKYLERWSPPGAAWEKDNVGLQTGSTEEDLKNVFLCLDLTKEALEEALNKNCNLIITHHPLIFSPLKKIITNDQATGSLIREMIKNDITLFSAHTNLDYIRGGVSFILGEKFGLSNMDFLKPETNRMKKIVVFVPIDHADKVAEAMFMAGAGNIGEYSECSFRLNGTGTFRGSEKSNPAVGEKGHSEKVDEIRLEAIANRWDTGKIISSIYESHPYEEPAFDIYPLENESPDFGAGVIGELDEAVPAEKFPQYVAEKLNIAGLRYTNGKAAEIKKVALCGGSGSEYLPDAIRKQADAYITGDIKYHTFQAAENRILFIDAGHYETEIFSLEIIEKKIKGFIPENENIEVVRISGSTNPVRFYNK